MDVWLFTYNFFFSVMPCVGMIIILKPVTSTENLVNKHQLLCPWAMD